MLNREYKTKGNVPGAIYIGTLPAIDQENL